MVETEMILFISSMVKLIKMTRHYDNKVHVFIFKS